MKTLTQQRIQFLRGITQELDFSSLRRRGPAGGKNAYRIGGWSKSPGAGWTVAARAVGIPEMSWWEGRYPTPATAFPETIVKEMVRWDMEQGLYSYGYVELPRGEWRSI